MIDIFVTEVKECSEEIGKTLSTFRNLRFALTIIGEWINCNKWVKLSETDTVLTSNHLMLHRADPFDS